MSFPFSQAVCADWTLKPWTLLPAAFRELISIAELAKVHRNLLLVLSATTDGQKGWLTQQRTAAGDSAFVPEGIHLSCQLSHKCVKLDKSLRMAFVCSCVWESCILPAGSKVKWWCLWWCTRWTCLFLPLAAERTHTQPGDCWRGLKGWRLSPVRKGWVGAVQPGEKAPKRPYCRVCK